jgi:hypothetical protein
LTSRTTAGILPQSFDVNIPRVASATIDFRDPFRGHSSDLLMLAVKYSSFTLEI